MESALRTHTLPQALSLLYDICQVPYKAKRTWKTLLEYLEKCDGDVQERIHRAAQAKIGSKRKAVDPITSDARAKKRPRLRDGHGQDQIPAHQSASRTVQELVDGPFLAIAPEHVLNDCIANFIDHTGNAAMAKKTCIVCARRMFARSFHTMAMGDIPNIHILRPTHPHHGHFLVDGALLHSTANPDSLNDVCKSCLGNLTKSTLPKLALANNMWLGDVPFELSILTLPEQLLVSLYFPAAYIIKIYPKNVKPSQDPAKRAEETIPIANEKLRGNVSTFRLPTNEIAHMVAGNNVPRPSLLLAAVIGVTFVGVNPKTMNIMPGIFRVRRQRVFDAVMWLKTHNAIYADVIISEENLRSLPEDGVPEEISQNITVSDDIDAVGREHAGYVPTSTGDHSDNEEDGQPDFTQDKDTEDDESDNLSIAHESTHSSVDNMEVEPIGTIPFSSPLVSTSNQRTTTDEPQVFPLQPHGVLDVGGNNIPETTLFSHAVENVVPALYAQDYGVRKGNAFVNEYARVDDNRERYDGGTIDPNHLLGAFPILFPYGLGGFEVDRQRKVTYEEHVKWALQYEDFRFRKHTLFAFQVFGVLLKRQICRSASLQIDHNQFLANQTAIKQLTPKDLLRASEEESTGRAISNPTIRLLRKHITTVRARVQGTDESRVAIRAQIWGMTIKYNPPTIWMTINLSDTNDPIAQVLAGQDIDLDDFVAKAGPKSTVRSQTIGLDPFAAAEYFHIVIRLLLQDMLGITVGVHGAVSRKEGIFGKLNGYIGTVEAQARGSLHLHMLLWLPDAPTSAMMQEALKSDAFRQKIKTFIRHNIRSDIRGVMMPAEARKRAANKVSYSRPVDPRKEGYQQKTSAVEDHNAAALQSHECSIYYCLKSTKGRVACKRGYPWPTYPDDWVDADGRWGAKRRFPFLNPWNPPIFSVTRSNMDIKLLTNACETKDIAFYITLYIAKKQVQAANASAVLARSRAFVRDEDSTTPVQNANRPNNTRIKRSEIQALNLRLLEQCANTLSRQYELSGPEVMSYLMGWGDRYMSHTFVKLYWDSITANLHRRFPYLKTSADYNAGASQAGTIILENGEFTLQDQLGQYADRGEKLEDMNMYEFFLRTYHVSSAKGTSSEQDADDTEDANRIGRPPNQRVPYTDASGRAGLRVLRGTNQETALHLVGRWLPKVNDINQENYAAQVLLLLKPWRTLDDLQGTYHSFADAKTAFLHTAPPEHGQIVENIQYYHDSSAQARHSKDSTEDPETTEDIEHNQDTPQAAEDFSLFNTLSQADIEEARRTQISELDQKYGLDGLAVAERAGIFANLSPTNPAHRLPLAVNATEEEMLVLKDWEAKVASITRSHKQPLSRPRGVRVNDDGGIEHVDHTDSDNNNSTPTQSDPNGGVERLIGDDDRRRTNDQQHALDILNREQRRAHNIIERHLRHTLNGVNQDQLLMIVQGEGGTGKTVLLNAVSHTFDFLQCPALLAKTGTTGISASLIEGQTLHQWAGIPVRFSEKENWLTGSSKKISDRRTQKIGPVRYLVIDEFSMLTKTTLAQLSHILGHVKSATGDAPPSRPFGNVNVILFGDPHQFPPVGNPAGALYDTRTGVSLLAQLGLAFYRQFKTVVTLTEQKRVQDPQWNMFLKRLRHGNCTESDMAMLRTLLVTDCKIPTDWQSSPWKDAVLVTPRHSCRILWNSASLTRHENLSGQRVYIVNAEDTATRTRRALTMHERVIVAGMNDKRTGKLQDRVEIAIGMRAMVLWNIATEADLANGTRSTITDLRLDPRELPDIHTDSKGRYILHFPPAVIFIKVDHFTFPPFEGLPPGVLPINPTACSFSISTSPSDKVTIRRRQYALTPGYAFTDYKSQGQTIPYVVVDLQNPPRGGLTPFNAYVALSRSRGRDSIRILRGFDPKLFTTHPSEALREEDLRLDKLTRQTREEFPLT